MDNTTHSRHNPHTVHRAQLKKNYRYNDSLSKYKKTIPNLVQKPKVDSNPTQNLNQNKFNEALTNLKAGLQDIPTEYKDNELPSNNLTMKRYDWARNKRVSLSAPKYHFLKSSTPKRDYNLRRKNIYINAPNILNDSNYLKTTDDFTDANERERKNKMSDILSSSFRTTFRTKSRPNFRPLYNTNDFNITTHTRSGVLNDINNGPTINGGKIGDSSKNKELIALNNILQKQNKELRQRTREMRYKINDLLNNIKLIRMDNQRINREKKK